MKKIIPLIISLITFSACFTFLNSIKKTTSDKKITVEIDLIAPSNNVFQIFYQQEGINYFSEKQSITARVNGNKKFQKVNFSIPNDKPINKLRIDIVNKQQEPIVIRKLNLKSSIKSLSYNFNDNFTPNKYIIIDKNKIKTKAINNLFDPYFISNFNVKDEIKKVTEDVIIYDKKTTSLLSLILSISLFISLLYKKISFKNLHLNYYIAIFIIILSSPIVIKVFDIKIKTTVSEKRELTTKPEFKLTKNYPREFEKYYNDNFGLRSMLVNLNSQLKLNYFKISPKPKRVQFGANGFAFLTTGYSIYSSYSNTKLLDEKKLMSVFNKQLSISKKLKEKNIEYIIGFWPNKHTIYSEEMPYTLKLQKRHKTSYADQTSSFFYKNGFPMIDVRQALFKAKKGNLLYQKLDTHWNNKAAYIAYKSFCEQTKSKLGLTPFKEDDFSISYNRVYGGDLTNMMGIGRITSHKESIPSYHLRNKELAYTIQPNDSIGLPSGTITTINKNCNNDKTVLVFGDSYTRYLTKFFSLHYKKITYIACPHPNYLNMALVEKLNPDIVMSLGVERYLPILLEK